MVLYHVNPGTGVLVSCESEQKCKLSQQVQHFVTPEGATTFFDTCLNTRLYNSSLNDYELDQYLEDSLTYGFIEADKTETKVLQAQLNILKANTSLEYIINKLMKDQISYIDRALFEKAFSWVVSQEADANHEGWKSTCKKIIDYHNVNEEYKEYFTSLNIESTIDDLLKASFRLWGFKYSPFHNRAKNLLFSSINEISGYESKDYKYSFVYDNSLITKYLNINIDELPEKVLTYDIETDTQFGFGLRPHKSQITEIVLTSKYTSWLFAGDEKFILESFSNFLNSQKDFTVLAGWNNFSFDNIFLQTRAEFHKISGWGGILEVTPNYSSFEPVGPSFDALKLIWNSKEESFINVDLYQVKKLYDSRLGLKHTKSLKSFVKSLGCNPIKVDRAKMHELNSIDRITYSLSDGLSTLRAYSELEK